MLPARRAARPRAPDRPTRVSAVQGTDAPPPRAARPRERARVAVGPSVAVASGRPPAEGGSVATEDAAASGATAVPGTAVAPGTTAVPGERRRPRTPVVVATPRRSTTPPTPSAACGPSSSARRAASIPTGGTSIVNGTTADAGYRARSVFQIP